jgi:hypothetical protein
MNGVLFVEDAKVEATTSRMLVTFTSGGDQFRFHIPAHTALKFRERIMRETWQVCCAPNADVVKLKPKKMRRLTRSIEGKPA